MKKYIIILLSIIVGGVIIFLIQSGLGKVSQIETLSARLEEKEAMFALLSGNMKMHYTYSEYPLSDMKLLDKNRNEITLSKLLKGKEKVVFKFSSDNCSSCIQFGFSSIQKLMRHISEDQLIIIADNSNRREVQALVNSLNLSYPIFLAETTAFERVLKKENTPFVFVVGADLHMKDLFIPMKELPEYADMYYQTIWKKYFCE